MLILSRSGRIALSLFIIILIAIAFAYYTKFNFGNIIQQPLPIPLVSIAGNWAGYEVSNNFPNPTPAIQEVSASWIVPSVKNDGADTSSSVWIGIGGQSDKTLIQVGTEQDFRNGSANYYAWYELLPSYSVSIPSFTVSPGDKMEASISLVDSNNSIWSISLEDLTNNNQFQNNFTYNSPRLTAEWIVERPEVNNALTQLSDFGTVSFTNCNAISVGQNRWNI